jgi:hypothetical protein
MSNRAMYTPASTQSRLGVGVLVFLEMHRRVLGGKFGSIPAPIRDDAFSMSGYCLDAHELMPAGSMRFHRFGPEPDDWIWESTKVERASGEGK